MKIPLVIVIAALAATAATGQTYEHVVITCDSFVSHFTPLCGYVEGSLGLIDTVVTTEAIYLTFSGRDNPEKIRNFIKSAYSNWGTTHVLLGGDVEIVPCRQAWVDAEYAHPLLKDSIACDLYYADLDGDWDMDGDCLFGEPEDSCDLYPDIFVGRVPATAAAAADLFVSKFLAYTGDPDAPYLRDVLLSGFDIFDGVHCETTMEFYDSAYVPPGMKSCNKVYDSHTGNHRTDVMSSLNQGQHVWVHADHADYTAMGMGWMNHSLLVTREALGQLTNSGKYTIMTSLGCRTGMFNMSDCASECFMQAPNGGGVAAASNSNYGVGDDGNPQRGYSMMLVEGFVRGLLSDPGNSNLGAIAGAWAGAVPYARQDLVYRWCLFCWNLLGEAAMPVWVPTSSGVEESCKPQAANRKLGPTVVRGVLMLRGDRTQNKGHRAELLDASGRKMMELQPGENNVSRLPAGVYYVTTGEGTRNSRVVIMGEE
jgi:hypothetical protein